MEEMIYVIMGVTFQPHRLSPHERARPENIHSMEHPVCALYDPSEAEEYRGLLEKNIESEDWAEDPFAAAVLAQHPDASVYTYYVRRVPLGVSARRLLPGDRLRSRGDHWTNLEGEVS